MRRLLPLFTALACLLFWGMLPGQGASASRDVSRGAKAGVNLFALPAATVDDDSQPGCFDASDGASDLAVEMPRAALVQGPATAMLVRVRLGDRRAATLVGTVVILI
ncbi:MAG TPA: hypothetical protein VGE76_22125 [Opitutaceae bacterium]